MKKIFAALLIMAMLTGLSACGAQNVRGSLLNHSNNEMAALDIMPQKLFEIAQIGDEMIVTVGNFSVEMPLVDELIEENGKLQLFYDVQRHGLYICAYGENFCESYNVAADAKVSVRRK